MKSNTSIRIFAVEDDPVFAKMLKYVLTLDPEHDVKIFSTGRELLDNLHNRPSLVTLDYSLPDTTGEELLKRVKYQDPDIPVIIISAQENVRTAVKLLKEGAYDYIGKDEDIRERLLNAINNAKKHVSLANEVQELREELSEKYDFERTIVGQSPAIKKVFNMLEKAVKTNITVSVTGETGTGKELIAKAIHFNSSRKKSPFIPVNIAAIPPTLLESELFGHEKGAFTGANARRAGKFEEANKGTIFLDEIGEMDFSLQAKLLRVLQERELVRIGGNEVVKLDVRIITATHKNLGEEVKKGNFREDLYYRLLGMPIFLPPLRERQNDVLIISKFLLENFCKENKMSKITISPEAQQKLLGYSWPGNIRELKAVIELAAVMCDNGKLSPNDIQFNNLNKDIDLLTQELSLREYIYKIVKNFLDKYDDNVILVAEKLDIGKSTIYRYLKEMEEMNIS
ncbi:sigma-54-dependent transcriptional regulator [Flexithrix dorotheae]|uniref:sigma-54-dependent transcriptional regulator n=1 Tax=Flexithrix dorotheae TaxID=70993 RepID=UPI000365A051|nr:sigma-54 dependent transcriptional regulator [Flexithrix dorotheae]